MSAGQQLSIDPEILNLNWYHANATRHIAESLLMQNGQDGSFLLRPSESRPGDMAISIRCRDSVRHFNVTRDGERYLFGLATFETLREFLEHFERQPMVAGESGQMAWLRYPYPRNIQEPDIYERVRVHGQYGEDVATGPHQFLSAASKEGYMTKLGGIVKNWKQRWFVLTRHHLRYFRHQTDSVPVRILDLHDCLECISDNTKNRPFCFRLVFPWRTFYFVCESEADKNDWMKMICWKLNQLRN